MFTVADASDAAAEDPARQLDSSQADAESIFPLKLVPFERYMLADSRPAYPMTFVLHVQLAGTPHREAMDRAFQEALQRHPLLTARLARHGLSWRWVSTDESPPSLRWSTSLAEPEPAIRPGTWIDLRHAAAVAGEIQLDTDSAQLVLLFHHAACDGIGAMRFLGDLLAYYALRTATTSDRPSLLPIDAANLAYRGVFDVRVPGPVSRRDVLLGTLREGWKVFSRRPLPLQAQRQLLARPRSARVNLLTTTLPEDVYLRYSAGATALGVTANDLMLRDMFVTVNAWNQQSGRRKRGWLRINVPTSLRGKRDNRMPATNVLGYALVTHHTQECDDPDRLLRTIAAETEAIRRWSLGALFVEALGIGNRLPGLLYTGTRLSRRFSTAVLSNLGDPVRRFRARFPRCGKEIRAGNLTIKSISGAPPIRPGTRAALVLTSYADRLVIGLNADPRWFSTDDATELLARYRRRLEQTAESSGAGTG